MESPAAPTTLNLEQLQEVVLLCVEVLKGHHDALQEDAGVMWWKKDSSWHDQMNRAEEALLSIQKLLESS